ncbi:unnamed protein product [Paramecium sonneborni]|uniref:Uncharacterized protein n=1 Tax=Paramecium sonneborni TaxID=65129 RepID=A0A8S1JST9_9CILI|nr:unnamed protein product [Paramecium sonneborni]
MNKQYPTYIVKETPRNTQQNEEPLNKRFIITHDQTKLSYKDIQQTQQKNEQSKNKQLLQKEYDTKCITYTDQYYSFLINQMLSRFAALESASQAATAQPLFKMLRGVTKKFMFNELEVLFFLHIIESQKWRFDDDPLIQNFIQYFKQDFLCNSEIYNLEAYKKLLLFLVCCGYTIKCFFNEQNDQDILLITEHIQSYCKEDFKKFIENWRQTYMNGALRTAPRIINKLFCKLMKMPRDGKQQDLQLDYNALVDSIIQLSPPYLSNDNKTQKKIDKLQNKEEQQQLEIQQDQQIQPINLQQNQQLQFSAQFILPFQSNQPNLNLFNSFQLNNSDFLDPFKQSDGLFVSNIKQEESQSQLIKSTNVFKK